MYKVTRNYTIEPNQIHVIRLTEGSSKLEGVLMERYSDFVRKAIEDVPKLCAHIEEKFALSSKKPLLPIVP